MSEETMRAFAEYMIGKSGFLALHYPDLSYWTDPEDPLSFGLIADIGHTITTEFETISPDQWAELVALIEEGLLSKIEDVDTAIATGLIETIVNVAERREGLWPRMDAALGPEARDYADAYRNAPFMNKQVY